MNLTKAQVLLMSDLKRKGYKVYAYFNDKGKECFLKQSGKDFEYCLYDTLILRALKRKGMIIKTAQKETVTVKRNCDLEDVDICADVYKLSPLID